MYFYITSVHNIVSIYLYLTFLKHNSLYLSQSWPYYNVWNKPKFKWKYILILFFICSVLLVPKIIYKNFFLYMIALHFQNPHPTLPLRINQLNFCPFLLVIKSCLVELCCFNSYRPNACFQVTWVIIFPDKSIYLCASWLRDVHKLCEVIRGGGVK